MKEGLFPIPEGFTAPGFVGRRLFVGDLNSG